METFEHLPWLVVYGDALWKVFIGVCFLIGLVVSLPRWRAQARKASRQTLDAFGGPIESLDSASTDEVVTLRGRLRAEKTIPQLHDDAPAVVSTAFAFSNPRRGLRPDDPAITSNSQNLYVVVDDEEVSLDDPVEAVLGSRELWTKRPLGLDSVLLRRLESLVPDQVEEALEFFTDKRLTIRSLSADDMVLLRGVVHRVPTGENEGYRSAGSRRVLRGLRKTSPAGELEAPKISACYEGHTQLSIPRFAGFFRPFFGSMIGVAGAVAVLYVLAWLTTPAYWTPKWRLDPGTPCPTLVPQFDFQIAAATPFGREAALRRLSGTGYSMNDRVLAREECHDRLDATLLEVARLRGDCARATQIQDFGHRLEATATLGRRCHDVFARRGAVEAFAALGRFKNASDMIDEMEPRMSPDLGYYRELRIHLLAGELDRAAEESRRKAPSGNSAFHCLADALEARGGDTKASDRLAARAGNQPRSGTLNASWLCHMLHLDLQAPEARPVFGLTPGEARRLSSLLALERSLSPETDQFLFEAFEDRWTTSDNPPGSLLEDHPSNPLLPFGFDGLEVVVTANLDQLDRRALAEHSLLPFRAVLHQRSAAFALFSGDHDRARRHVKQAVDDLSVTPDGAVSVRCHDVKVVEAMIELDSGAVTRAKELAESLSRDCHESQSRYAEEILALVAFNQKAPTKQLEALSRYGGGGEWSNRQAVTLAQSGHGAAMASLLESVSLFRYLPPLAPNTESERYALDYNAIHSYTYSPYVIQGLDANARGLPQELITVAHHRALSVVLGFERRTSELDDSLPTVREALLEREIAVPLWVVEQMVRNLDRPR